MSYFLDVNALTKNSTMKHINIHALGHRRSVETRKKVIKCEMI